MKKTAILLFLFCFCGGFAQIQKQYNAAEILSGLQKLKTIGSVLYIAAHPDDENTRLLAYLANEKKFRTGYLSLTRGDGGQNLIGKEQGELLGLIRTNELLAARNIDGAEQFFTRANDFGYSKTPDETFSIWNKDSILSDMVWVIRNFKPDVIICRFPTTGEGGHGHHTASAILAEEAFDAAADPNKFPEQLKYVSVWKTKRLFWNTFNFGGTNTTADDQLKIDVGVYNPLSGKYYGEIASESRSMHKSQGFGSAKTRGTSIEYFKFLKGEPAVKDPFENINTTWKRLEQGEKIDKLITSCITSYNIQAPENRMKILVTIYNQVLKLKGNSDTDYWKKQKLKETEELLLACGGFWAEAYTNDFSSSPGNMISISAQAISKNQTPIEITKIGFPGEDSLTQLRMQKGTLYTFKHIAPVKKNEAYTQPYWLKENHSIGLYTVSEQLQRGKAINESTTKVVFEIIIAGLALKVERPLTYKYTDPVKGEIYRPFEILPPVTININEKILVFTPNEVKQVSFTVKANSPDIKGTLQLQLPDGWIAGIDNADINLKNKGDETVIIASISSVNASGTGELKAIVKSNNETFTNSIQRIEYDHIPYQFILKESKIKLVIPEVKKTGLNIAYIPGAGDEVQACLKQIGYKVTELTDEMIASGDLSQYDAIVTGIRAHNTNERLQQHYKKLMEYIEKGGNLIVQYNTNSRVGPVVAKIGPYPFTVTRNRVTNENAEVSFINPQHIVLNYPNKITSSDFEGWVQERGIYFAGDLDKKYETILKMKDPGENEQDGSLIIAKHGKGNFVYTGLAFFRELPAGVPGAYRLFVNLLSLPQNK